MSYTVAALPMALYTVALILGVLDVPLGFADDSLSPLAQWMLFLSLGLQSLWAALGHAVFRQRVADSIGWDPSPFQFEIAGANLGIGLGAIAASMLGEPAGWAIFFVAAGFLWSAAATHIRDMIAEANFAINNAGPIFWWDLLTPLTLLIALW
ncbi:MAG: DUF6790 family protein [Methyloligella sp. ZOD6]